MSTGVTALISSGVDAFDNLWDVEITFPTGSTLFNAITASSTYTSGFIDTASNFSSNVLSLRADQPKWEELKADQYPIEYKGAILKRFKPNITGKRELSITFRVDYQYHLYNLLTVWKHFYSDPTAIANVTSNLNQQASATPRDMNANYSALTPTNGYGGAIIRIYPYTSSQKLSADGYSGSATTGATTGIPAAWTFKDCVCVATGQPQFERNDSKEVTINAKFIYGQQLEFATQG